MSIIEKGLARSRAIYNTAETRAIQLKQAGGLDLAPMGGLSQLNQFRDQGANRQRYALNRGWVYAAVSALAKRGARQPVNLAEMERSTRGRNSRSSPGRTKSHVIRKMTGSISTKAADEELEVIKDHPFLDALNQPNPIQSRWAFVHSFISNLNLTGWGFVIKGETEDGRPQFFSLPTTWVRPDHKDGPFSKFRIVNPNNPTADQNKEPLDGSLVRFAYIPNPSDPLAALAPAAAESDSIKIDDSIRSSQRVFFDNGIFPSAIITVGKDPHPDVASGIRPRLSAAQRRQVFAAIRKVSSGVANYGNPAIIDGLIERIDRLSATSNEMGWEKSEKSIKRRILSAFGVHPFMLGEEMVGSYAQAYVVQSVFCENVNTYLDMLGLIMTGFANDDEEEQQERFLAWWEKCTAEDPQLEQKKWSEARKNDDITQNEFRTYLGLPPDEDRNQSVIGRQDIQPVTALAGQVFAGKLSQEQAVAILEARGIPTEQATRIAGEPSEQQILQEATDELEEAVRALNMPAGYISDKVMEEARTALNV